jgi:glycosyltransferase involved in cell wall biosynthesis
MESTSLEQLKAGRSPVHRWAGRLATRRQFAAHRVCFTLDRYVQLARAHYGVQNAVHVPHHVFAPPRRHRVAKRGTRLLYFGLQAPFKGVDVLLDAFHAARLALPDLRLDLAGGRHPRFGGIAAARESGAGIAWHGQVSDEAADRLVAGADVVVVPSLASPGASSVIHRAAAQGKAIVASDLPDYRALAAEQGFAVEFCPPGDGQALAEAIHRVCLSSGLRLRAREVNLAASARVTPAVIAGRYVALFQSALAPAASPAMALTRAPVELAAS